MKRTHNTPFHKGRIHHDQIGIEKQEKLVVKFKFKTTKLRSQRQKSGIMSMFYNTKAHPTEQSGQPCRVYNPSSIHNSPTTREPLNQLQSETTLTNEKQINLTKAFDNPDCSRQGLRQAELNNKGIKPHEKSTRVCSKDLGAQKTPF